MAALVAVSLSACAPSLKDMHPVLSAASSGTIRFASAGSVVWSGDRSRLEPGRPVVISGVLALPSGTGPFPAVILAHGCGGVGHAEAAWAPVLREWGYATFIVDSFRGRNVMEVCTSAGTLSGTERIPDVYGALRVLAFYPYCNAAYPEWERLSAPVRIHTGELDDWNPAAPCVSAAETLVRLGQDVTVTVYPRAHHSFDNVGRPFLRLAHVDSGAGCAFRVASLLGPFPSPIERALCVRKGGTIASSREATEQARRNVHAQLAELLR